MQQSDVPRRAVALLLLCACQSYRAQPLEPQEILRTVETRRAQAPAEGLTLRACEALLRERNPRVAEARAALAVAQAQVAAGTPLANPELDLSIFAGRADGVDAAVGWAVSLAGARGLLRDRNALEAEVAALDAAAAEREEYLAMRREYAAVAVATARARASESLLQSARALVELSDRLVAGASATALDAQEARIEALRAEAAHLAALGQAEEARARLGARLGLDAALVPACALPAIPAEAAEVRLIESHTGLAALRARYELAEQELRLEIARQYPALRLGPAYEREDGSSRYGLALGIELPVFDRNQVAIAAARARRESVRTGYEAEVERRLAAIDAARRRIASRAARERLLSGSIVPAAGEALAQARRSLEAGSIDAMRLLLLVRASREIELESSEAAAELVEAWFDLAEACGAPVVSFPEEVP